jgi:hypothetical protein
LHDIKLCLSAMYDDLSHVYVEGPGPGEALACARADGLDQSDMGNPIHPHPLTAAARRTARCGVARLMARIESGRGQMGVRV